MSCEYNPDISRCSSAFYGFQSVKYSGNKVFISIFNSISSFIYTGFKTSELCCRSITNPKVKAVGSLDMLFSVCTTNTQ